MADSEEEEAIVEAQNNQTESHHDGESHGARVCKYMSKVHFGFKIFLLQKYTLFLIFFVSLQDEILTDCS